LKLELIKLEIDKQVATITMDAPPVNAQSVQLTLETAYVFDYISDLDDVRAAVLTGAGKVFSAGADLNIRDSLEATGERWQHNRRVRESFHAVRECMKPVIAAINGPALGAGLALAASCDILVAAEEASLGLPEIDVGLLGGQSHAKRLFPHSTLRRMALCGYRVSGKELYRLGVVEACVPRGRVVAAARKIAFEITQRSPYAVRLGKQSLNVIEELSLRDGYRHEQKMTAQLALHPDAREATAAFLEKRKPDFKS
jgi:enoyl-CoA hydratase